ncbi:hypothetical protein C4J65_19230 [Streptomyces sp. CB09001]|uniref:hypothetical protein n=1 Tax=Streptomyces sp. CB09001 TaxID=2083284 RepID=UPI000E20ECB0|nr:hypothetical protein [Streptomyces sp. CB09001]AXL90180.1 hypothetical protein C4J65_19230 [Streptomyces sp. CB09001]
MSETEKKPTDVVTMENHAPAPPVGSAEAKLLENHAPQPPAEEQITTLENHAPAPPALDLDGDGK